MHLNSITFLHFSKNSNIPSARIKLFKRNPFNIISEPQRRESWHTLTQAAAVIEWRALVCGADYAVAVSSLVYACVYVMPQPLSKDFATEAYLIRPGRSL